jgi:hypothetical protein
MACKALNHFGQPQGAGEHYEDSVRFQEGDTFCTNSFQLTTLPVSTPMRDAQAPGWTVAGIVRSQLGPRSMPPN